MPKRGMEPIRRDALVKAAIAEIGQAGTLEVSVGRIARRAGMSTALAHHYFGGKDQLLVAAMRHILAGYGAAVRAGLARAETPRGRLEAVLAASFAPPNFEPQTVAAWLNLYVQAPRSAAAARLLRLYHARLRSNLVHALRPLAGGGAPALAETAAALIDGFYLRAALGAPVDGARATQLTRAAIDAAIAAPPDASQEAR